MLIVDELEKLTGQFSFENGRIATIKLKDEIVDKMEGYFDSIKPKLKPSELSVYNFSIAEIQNIVPAKLDREMTFTYSGLNEHPLFRQLIHHIRIIISLFRTVHYRATL
jgi:hypothetical protein